MCPVIAYVTEKERRDVATVARSIRGLRCCQTASTIYFSLLWSWVISYLFLEPGLLLLLFWYWITLLTNKTLYISRLAGIVPVLLVHVEVCDCALRSVNEARNH